MSNYIDFFIICPVFFSYVPCFEHKYGAAAICILQQLPAILGMKINHYIAFSVYYQQKSLFFQIPNVALQ